MTFIMMAACISFVLAEDNTSAINDTSATPMLISENPMDNSSLIAEATIDDNATVSSGEIAWNQIKTWFTLNQQKKAELELKLADLRLIQARIAAKNNNTIAMQKALDSHERILERLNVTMSKIESGPDMSRLNASGVKLVALERAIQVHELKIERLNERLTNANLTDEQKSKIETRLAHVEEVTSQLKERAIEKENKIQTKLMAVGNLTEKQAQKMIRMNDKEAKIDQKLAEAQAKENRQEARAKKG